jgi:hypothetical protein
VSGFENLLALPDERTLEIARKLIGQEELAFLLTQAAISQTASRIKSKAVADLFCINEDSARKRLKCKKSMLIFLRTECIQAGPIYEKGPAIDHAAPAALGGKF